MCSQTHMDVSQYLLFATPDLAFPSSHRRCTAWRRLVWQKHFWDKNNPFGLHLHGETPLGHALTEFFLHWSGKGWTSESWQQRSKAGRFARLVGGVTRSCICPTAPSVPSRRPSAPSSLLMRDSPSSDSDSQLSLRVTATFWHFCPSLGIFIPTLPPISSTNRLK